MTLSIIVTAANHGVIGRKNGLPWKLPAEMAYFKATTTGHPIIMGRKTYESIGRPLPERTNIIITRNSNTKYRGSHSTGSLGRAIELAKKSPGAEEIFIIGGESVYAEALSVADRIYLTKIDADIENGDKFFKYDEARWRVVSENKHQADTQNQYSYSFLILERKLS